MPKSITFEGQQYTFPDDATDEEIAAELESSAPPSAPDMSAFEMSRKVNSQEGEPGALDRFTQSDIAQGAAHPKTAGDILSLLVPSGIEGAVSGAKTLAKSFADIVPGTGALAYPRAIMRRVVDRFTSPHSLAEVGAAKNAETAAKATKTAEEATFAAGGNARGGTTPAPPPPAPVVGPDLGPAPKPRWSAAEVAAKGRAAVGSERAGKMLYGTSKGGNVIGPAARKEAIQRLAPGSSKLPDTNRAAIIKKMESMSFKEAYDYAMKAPSAVAQEFFAELLKRPQGATLDDYLGSLNPNWNPNVFSTASTRTEPFLPSRVKP